MLNRNEKLASFPTLVGLVFRLDVIASLFEAEWSLHDHVMYCFCGSLGRMA